jgi:hypothetical protein
VDFLSLALRLGTSHLQQQHLVLQALQKMLSVLTLLLIKIHLRRQSVI